MMRGTAHMRPVADRRFWGFCSRRGCRDPSQIPTHTDFSVPGILLVSGFPDAGGLLRRCACRELTEIRVYTVFLFFGVLPVPGVLLASRPYSRRGLYPSVFECLVLRPGRGVARPMPYSSFFRENAFLPENAQYCLMPYT